LQIQVLNASNSGEIDAAFATFVRERPDALFVSGDPLFTGRRAPLILLATRHAIPATYAGRQFPEIGGLMSYGASLTDAWRQVGAYAPQGRQASRPAGRAGEQVRAGHRAQAARMLGLTVPPTLLARADEVIE